MQINENKKISISGMIQKREKKKPDISPPENIKTQENTQPKIKLHLGKKKIENTKTEENTQPKIKLHLGKKKIENIQIEKDSNTSRIKLSLGNKKENIENNKSSIKISLNKKSNNIQENIENKTKILDKEDNIKLLIESNKIQENKSSNKEKIEILEKENEISKNKSSFHFKKPSIKENNKKEESVIIENKEEILNTKKEPPNQKNVENIIEKKPNINLKEPPNQKNEVQENILNKKEEIIEFGDQKLIKETESIFNNYESDFDKESNFIIERLKKLKNISKTRPILIYGLIGITILFIGGLLILKPNIYNVQNLETDIIGIENTNKNNAEKVKVIEIVWEKEHINKYGKDITYKYRTDKNGKKVYKYKDILYNNIKELNKQIDKDYKIKDILGKAKDKDKNKLDKIKNFLIKNKK